MGIQTLALLRGMGLELSQLAPLNRTGAKLDGNDMVLDQYTVCLLYTSDAADE